MSKFPCTKCGICCVMAGRMGLMPQREDGACKYLGYDNLCTIYDTRPDLCNLNKVRKVIGMEESKFNIITANACNELQEMNGIDETYRVRLRDHEMDTVRADEICAQEE